MAVWPKCRLWSEGFSTLHHQVLFLRTASAPDTPLITLMILMMKRSDTAESGPAESWWVWSSVPAQPNHRGGRSGLDRTEENQDL